MQQAAHLRPLGDETTHFWQVQRMAKATGVDLITAWERGLLTPEDWVAIVHRCRACRWAEGCDHWLEARSDDARDLPGPCLNNTWLAQIRARLEESMT